jgi:hypothetical protein
MQTLQTNRCRFCGHALPDGDKFCDPVCEEEYHMAICVGCNQFHSRGHTVSNCVEHPEWVGRRICKECWEAL